MASKWHSKPDRCRLHALLSERHDRTCPTAKSKFPSELEAERWVSAWNALHGNAAHDRRYHYECTYCDGWHVTKTEHVGKRRPRFY